MEKSDNLLRMLPAEDHVILDSEVLPMGTESEPETLSLDI